MGDTLIYNKPYSFIKKCEEDAVHKALSLLSSSVVIIAQVVMVSYTLYCHFAKVKDNAIVTVIYIPALFVPIFSLIYIYCLHRHNKKEEKFRNYEFSGTV